MKKGLLFINGVAPKTLPDCSAYDLVACTDGAVDYLLALDSDMMSVLDFISGDFDSHHCIELDNPKFIETPDQDKTDFQKALELIAEKGVTTVDVYGGSGGEMDHFLGNLSVAHFMKSILDIRFFDEFSSYYFIPKEYRLFGVKGKMISLFPFPRAARVTTTGLKWTLDEEDLDIGFRIGTRNVADNDEVSFRYDAGDLLIFVGN